MRGTFSYFFLKYPSEYLNYLGRLVKHNLEYIKFKAKKKKNLQHHSVKLVACGLIKPKRNTDISLTTVRKLPAKTLHWQQRQGTLLHINSMQTWFVSPVRTIIDLSDYFCKLRLSLGRRISEIQPFSPSHQKANQSGSNALCYSS